MFHREIVVEMLGFHPNALLFCQKLNLMWWIRKISYNQSTTEITAPHGYWMMPLKQYQRIGA
jgi:hypothetical protein